MSSSSSLPDTQLASLIDRPNFSNLASGEQSHRRALGLHLSQLQSKLLPLEVLAWHVSEVKRCILIHSTPVNPQHMIQLDSHQCPSNNCINSHNFTLFGYYSDTIQIYSDSSSVPFLILSRISEGWWSWTFRGHRAPSVHLLLPAMTSSQALCLTASPVIRPMILHYTSHHMSSTVQYCHLVLFTTWLLPSHKRYSTYVYIWYVRPQPIFQPKGAQHISSMQPPITPPSVSPHALTNSLLISCSDSCHNFLAVASEGWSIEHHQSHQTNWIKLDQIGSTYRHLLRQR